MPTSRQVVSDADRPAFSQSSWARPVRVRSGSSTSPSPRETCCERKERRSRSDRSASLPKRSRAVGGALDRRADRHPLEVRLLRRGLPGGPGALRALGVVRGAARPGVVGELVVVPDRDDRRLGVQRLEVRVGLVRGVPQPVVGEGDDFVGGGVRADDLVTGAVLAGAVLVDVVAQVQPGVQVAAGREMAVRREVAGLPVGAGHHAEPQPGHRGVGGRGGAGAGDGRVGAARGEAEPVVGGRAQAAYVRLDGVVGGGGGEDGAPRDDVGERPVAGDGPAHLGVRADAGAGVASGAGVTRVHSSTPSGSGSPEATPCRKAGAERAARAAGATASGPARAAPGGGRLDDRAAARGEGAVSAVAETALSVLPCRLVTADQVTDAYMPERANSGKVRPLFSRPSDRRVSPSAPCRPPR